MQKYLNDIVADISFDKRYFWNHILLIWHKSWCGSEYFSFNKSPEKLYRLDKSGDVAGLGKFKQRH